MAINQKRLGAILQYCQIFINIIIGLIYSPIMLRILGQNEYGIYIEDSNGNVLDQAEGLIKPKCKLGISDRMLEFIHVSKDKLEHAPYYSKFYNKLRDYMMYYQPTIYVWGKNDMSVIDKSYKIHEKNETLSDK